mmetsp:Transcript_33447/g.105687  ORF Transcript_33447/g.105687 Transcript_33447/m.105687 type:complete len:201 (+) Transcript_33447:3347-3949(+)
MLKVETPSRYVDGSLPVTLVMDLRALRIRSNASPAPMLSFRRESRGTRPALTGSFSSPSGTLLSSGSGPAEGRAEVSSCFASRTWSTAGVMALLRLNPINVELCVDAFSSRSRASMASMMCALLHSLMARICSHCGFLASPCDSSHSRFSPEMFTRNANFAPLPVTRIALGRDRDVLLKKPGAGSTTSTRESASRPWSTS